MNNPFANSTWLCRLDAILASGKWPQSTVVPIRVDAATGETTWSKQGEAAVSKVASPDLPGDVDIRKGGGLIWDEQQEAEFQERKRRHFMEMLEVDRIKADMVNRGELPACPECGSHRYTQGILAESCETCGYAQGY